LRISRLGRVIGSGTSFPFRMEPAGVLFLKVMIHPPNMKEKHVKKIEMRNPFLRLAFP